MLSASSVLVGRFLTVGLACALLHNAVMIGGDWLGLHYAASSVVSFAIVVTFGYLLHSGWTFAGKLKGSSEAPLATHFGQPREWARSRPLSRCA